MRLSKKNKLSCLWDPGGGIPLEFYYGDLDFLDKGLRMISCFRG